MNRNRSIKNVIAKVGMGGVTAAMALASMGVPAFAAAGTNYGAVIEGTKTTTFDKYLVMDLDAHVPNVSFT